jgi:hypothetical protein
MMPRLGNEKFDILQGAWVCGWQSVGKGDGFHIVLLFMGCR